MMHGYFGKVLIIDLTTSIIETEEQDEIEYRKYMGGSLMAVKYLMQNTKPNIDPLSPENILMFFSGLLGGHAAPGLARFSICAKSPVTEGIGEARCEGPFSLALKMSGYDGIVIKGKSAVPKYLVIDSGEVKLIPCRELWGLSVPNANKLIQKDFPGSETAIIGQAGENLVRYANVICSLSHQASRAGMGAVMGSKNLKAVVLRGGNLPSVANPNGLKQLSEWFNVEMQKNVLSMWQYNRPGFGVWIHTHGIDSAVCVNNYQTSKCSYIDAYSPEKFAPFYSGESSCPHCPNQCIKRYSTDKSNSESGGLHQEALGALGPNLGVSDVNKIIESNELCNKYGLDPNSLGYTISFAQECYQNNLIKDCGLNLSFSNEVDLVKIIEEISFRSSPLGNILAEGSYRAAKLISDGAEKYTMTVKKNELTAFELRTQTNLALGFATATMGPRYEICEHDWDFDLTYGWDHTLNYCRTIGILERTPMNLLSKEKVRNFKALNHLWFGVESLGMCIFASAPTRVYSLEKIAELINAITGYETSSFEVMRLGALKNNLFRAFNYREGFSAEDDMLPDRFFEEPVDAGPMDGSKLNREKFREVIDFYYQMMGWDTDGKPLPATLSDFGLSWIFQNISD